ncbi:MAG: ABC transporter substrate-binding protein [Chloroflexi bacterium]|nr:ABC transporter substrate-binding protein [Chloroflexota bacterium]
MDPVGTSKYLVFSKLFTRWSDPPQNCQGEIYPWVVNRWRWLSDTVAEFTLKPGVTYQKKAPANGREMVASDVVASFQRFRNVPFMKVQSDKVDSVTATDKYTFQMKTKFPWGGLVTEMLAFQYGVWVEPAEITGPDWDWSTDPPKAWVGSGPFILKKWVPAVKWTFERNPDYWVKGKPYLDGVEYLVMPEASVHMAALRSGQLNAVRDLSEPMIDELQKRFAGFQVIRCPGGSTSGAGALWMNNSGPPFSDVRVRRAVSMAIDRQAVISSLYSSKAANVHIVAPSMQYALALQDFPPEMRQFLEYHPDRAKQFLAEAGYPAGFETTITFSPRYAAPAPMVAEAVAGMLGAVGIRAKINMMEYTRYVDYVVGAKYSVGEMAISPVDATTPEGALSLASFYSKTPGGRNRSLVNDPEYDKLFERFVSSTNDQERTTLARQL